MLESHVSVVTSLDFSNNFQQLFSAGRDRVVNVWNLKSKKLEKTLPVYETVEALHVLSDDCEFPGKPVSKVKGDAPKTQFFSTAGDKGQLRIWSSDSGKCVHEQTFEENSSQQSLVSSM